MAELVDILDAKTARVNDGEDAAAPLHVAVESIARRPGRLVHHREPRAYQSVEERRFADVRSADERDDWPRHSSAGLARPRRLRQAGLTERHADNPRIDGLHGHAGWSVHVDGCAVRA